MKKTQEEHQQEINETVLKFIIDQQKLNEATADLLQKIRAMLNI